MSLHDDYLVCGQNSLKNQANIIPSVVNLLIIIDGNSEIDAHGWNEIGNLTCLRH